MTSRTLTGRTWKTRPTRGRVVYGIQHNAAAGRRFPATFPPTPAPPVFPAAGRYQPSGRRYGPTGSGS